MAPDSPANETESPPEGQPPPIFTPTSFEREIRFAVVIYGGVSLAIYINGVVQELFHMVRATADPEPQSLSPVEQVYRKLSCIVGRGDDRRRKDHPEPDPDDLITLHCQERGGRFEAETERRRTKFVVDVLSGTSAGGINAIYLAKALVNNRSLRELARMWIDVADISKLLNDPGSAEFPVKPQSPPKSLLNSRWMYLKLIEALDAMDLKPENRLGEHPLVGDLDLFSTTTDIDGVTVPIALADRQVKERRHRNVFHFKHRNWARDGGTRQPASAPPASEKPRGGSDARTAGLHPLLAFLLGGLDFLLRRDRNSPAGNSSSGDDKGAAVHAKETPPKRKRRKSGRNDFELDMNPFLAFAARCTSAFPFAFEPMALCDVFDVIRYLPAHRGRDYCQPNTGHWEEYYLEYVREVDPHSDTEFRFRAFGDGGYLDNKPFSYAIETIKKRHADRPVDRKLIYVEPSPQDVDTKSRNRAGADDRADAVENSLAALVELPRYETIREDLETVLQWNRNIKRLKRVIAHADNSINTVLRDTRRLAEYREGPAYDFYMRLRFSAVTDLMATQVAKAIRLDPKSARAEAIRVLAGEWRLLRNPDRDEFLDTYDREHLLRAAEYIRNRVGNSDELRENQRDLLELAECDLPDVTAGLPPERILRAEARNRDLDFITDPTTATETWPPPGVDHREDMLKTTTAGQRLRARFLLDHHRWIDLIDAAHRNLSTAFGPRLRATRAQLYTLMENSGIEGGWKRFEVHDSLVFPVTFATALGELDPIDVIRISPDDVADIEGVDTGTTKKGPKLKGETLSAFGGFLERRWRLHDMLRGRLHGAERLITAVLPNCDSVTTRLREELIKEAQEAIAQEWDQEYGTLIKQEEERLAGNRDHQAAAAAR